MEKGGRAAVVGEGLAAPPLQGGGGEAVLTGSLARLNTYFPGSQGNGQAGVAI